jgi:SAM-dependent methyltransferase
MRFSLSHLAAGHIAEFGSANGGSGLFMATVARKYCPDLQVLCFDTFEGMPSTDSSRDAHKKGDFEGIDFNEINSVAASLNLQNISFIKGLLQETAPMILPNFSPIVMTHIDVDIYESVKCAYNIIKEHMVPGGYIVFDDPLAPSCIGALEAVEECLVRRDQLHAEQAWPHLVFRAP